MLNDATKKDSFPMPNVTDTLARMAGSKIYSGYDMHGAFNAVGMTPSAKEKKRRLLRPHGDRTNRLSWDSVNGLFNQHRIIRRAAVSFN